MSCHYYNEMFLVTQKDMERLLELDRMIQSTKSPKSNDAALNAILPIYLKYRDLVHRLIICYDQMIQPQKRRLIKQLLDCAIGRMLEYNQEIVGLEFNDYQWPDETMIKLKMTPDDVAFPVSKSYTADRKVVLQERRRYIEDLINNATKVVDSTAKKKSTGEVESEEVKFPMVQPLAESPGAKELKEAREIAKKAFVNAILMIQSHERARAARCIGARAERLFDYNKRLASGELEAKKFSNRIKNEAATLIQKNWRGYLARKSLKQRMDKIEEILHTTIPSWKDKSIFHRDKNNYEKRLELQREAVEAMEETVNKERARVFRIHGPGLMEDITDEIREWFLLWYNELGYFDSYPIAEVGGSVLVATGQTFTPDEYLVERAAKADQATKKKEPEKKADKNKSAAKKGKATNNEEGWTMPEESKALEDLTSGRNEFVRDWSLRDKDVDNHRRLYLDLINDKLYHELQLEMREVVDELMRLELNKFNEALLKDHAGDKEKFVIPTLVKSKKDKKKKKRKEKKDPLAALPIEEMFDELVLAKIIHNYPEERLEDWQGDVSYQNYEARLQLRDFQPRYGDIKQSVMKYCVLPLGSHEVHAIAPLVRSVCIAGLPFSGKSFLANAICTEVGALLFDLTPSVLVGQYEGKKNQDKLLKMIGKLARIYAPSIVFIDGGEKPWMKKIPPAERYTQPKRFAKLLPKFVKTIKPGDQILFLTLATEPYNATKPFIKIHDKWIIIPITDYGTIYLLYKNLLMGYHGVDRNFDVSSLAKVSLGYPIGIIREAVHKVMNTRRIIQLRFKPLQQEEILNVLLAYDTPTTKIIEQFKNFEKRKTPLGKTRTKMIEALKESQTNPQEKKK